MGFLYIGLYACLPPSLMDRFLSLSLSLPCCSPENIPTSALLSFPLPFFKSFMSHMDPFLVTEALPRFTFT